MTKEVLLTISGLHYDSLPDEDENEPIEVITPATYYLKNGKHYVIYDEMVEGMPGTIQNKIRIAGNNLLEIKKSGLANTKMVFERDKLIGIFTKNMQVDVTEKNIDVCVNYELDINSEKVANCDIKMNIRANAPG